MEGQERRPHMKELLFTCAQMAGTPGFPKTESGVWKLVKRGSWEPIPRQGQGGGSVFPITVFPRHLQAALLLRYAPISSAGPLFPAASCQTLPQGLDSSAPVSHGAEASYSSPLYKESRERQEWFHRTRTGKQQAVGVKKASAIDQALGRIAEGDTCTRSWAKAANWYGCSRETLQYRWYPKVKAYHRSDWPAVLCQGYNGCTARAEFSPEALEFVKTAYLRQEKPSLTACYRLLERTAKTENWVIPSFATVRRRILREVSYETRVFGREGNEGLMKIYPAQERSVSVLYALEWINGDGYEHNVFVKWPDGTIHRPKTWFIQDAYSRKILAWRTDQTEHTDLIRLATGDVIEKYGIPEHCVIDNTRAAANKWMTGGVKNRYRFKIKDDDPLGMFPMLGIQTHWTSVNFGHGHGQAKPVERAFGGGGIGEVVDKHPAFAGAWTGNSPSAKPENYGSRAIPIADFQRIRDQEIAAHNAQPNRRTEMGGGKLSFDEVFNESYKKSVIRKATAEQRALWLLAAEAIFIHRDATFTLNAGRASGLGRNRYYANPLYDYVGQKLVVRFDPDDLHADTHIYSTDGRYITAAACVDPVGFGDTEAAREHNRARKQFIRATKDRANALVRMDAMEVAKLIPPMPSAEPVEATVVQIVRPSRTLFEHRVPKSTLSAEQIERERIEFAANKAKEAEEEAAEAHRRRWPPLFNLDATQLYDYWMKVRCRALAGEILPEHARRFYEHFPSTTDYQLEKQAEIDRGIGTEDEVAAGRERRRWPALWTLDDAGKYKYWHELDRRLQAGEKFPEDARRFFEAFPTTLTFQSYQQVERDLASAE